MSDQKRLYFAVSLYPFSFFANTPFKCNIVQNLTFSFRLVHTIVRKHSHGDKSKFCSTKTQCEKKHHQFVYILVCRKEVMHYMWKTITEENEINDQIFISGMTSGDRQIKQQIIFFSRLYCGILSQSQLGNYNPGIYGRKSWEKMFLEKKTWK